MDALGMIFEASLWAAAIRIASPLIFATLGELICERAGVLNLGIEGIMTVGAFAGWVAVYNGADLWTGVLIAALAGAAFGVLHGFLTVPQVIDEAFLGLAHEPTELLLELGIVGCLARTLFVTGLGLLDREVDAPVFLAGEELPG